MPTSRKLVGQDPIKVKRGSSRSLRLHDVEYVRTNGFDKPNSQQIGAWIGVTLVGLAYFSIVENVALRWRPAAYIVVGSCLSLLVLLLFICTIVDPADPAVRLQRRQGIARKRGREDLNNSMRSRVIENDECFLCEAVVGYKTKHCGTCNKCVSGFDHHCVWLNNCVGSRTYHLFISLLVVSMFCTLAVATVTVAIIIHRYKNDGGLKPAYTALGRPISADALVAVACLITIFVALAAYFIADLLLLHARLSERGWTTYDYIVHLREQDRRKEAGEPLERPLGYPCGCGSSRDQSSKTVKRSNKVAPAQSPPDVKDESEPAQETRGNDDGSVTPPHGTVDVFHVVTHPLSDVAIANVPDEGSGGDTSVGGSATEKPTAQKNANASMPRAPASLPPLCQGGLSTPPTSRRIGRLPPLSPVAEMSRSPSPSAEKIPLTETEI